MCKNVHIKYAYMYMYMYVNTPALHAYMQFLSPYLVCMLSVEVLQPRLMLRSHGCIVLRVCLPLPPQLLFQVGKASLHFFHPGLSRARLCCGLVPHPLHFTTKELQLTAALGQLSPQRLQLLFESRALQQGIEVTTIIIHVSDPQIQNHRISRLSTSLQLG